MAQLYEFRGRRPILDSTVFVADGARIVGDVSIGRESSVWFNAILRGDVGSIQIGPGSNIQDLVCIHGDPDFPVRIGDRVTVGHGCILHGCRIEDDCLIGMGSIILNGAEIGEHTIIGAGSIIAAGRKIPPRSLVAATPGRAVRVAESEEWTAAERAAAGYRFLGSEYMGNAKNEGNQTTEDTCTDKA